MVERLDGNRTEDERGFLYHVKQALRENAVLVVKVKSCEDDWMLRTRNPRSRNAFGIRWLRHDRTASSIYNRAHRVEIPITNPDGSPVSQAQRENERALEAQGRRQRYLKRKKQEEAARRRRQRVSIASAVSQAASEPFFDLEDME